MERLTAIPLTTPQDRAHKRMDIAERFCIVLPRTPRDLRWRCTRAWVPKWIRKLTMCNEEFEIYEQPTIGDTLTRGDPYTWDLGACVRVYSSKTGKLEYITST